jgi:hypothetical protein
MRSSRSIACGKQAGGKGSRGPAHSLCPNARVKGVVDGLGQAAALPGFSRNADVWLQALVT